MPHNFSDFQDDPELLLATAAELYDAQGREDLGDLMRVADLSLDESGFDNWNGGITSYTAVVQVPVNHFPTAQQEIARVEASVLQKFQICTKHCQSEQVSSVALQPKVVKGKQWRRKGKPLTTTRAEEASAKIWKKAHFRLFLSHSSANKKHLAELKKHLEVFGVASFLAHEDIHPSEEWLNSIQVALMTCDALAAFITDEFRASLWTDQEVGIAVGQGIFVLPVKVGKDPYGFIGKIQAVNGWWEDPKSMAKDIVTSLLSNSETATAMKSGLVSAVEAAGSYENAKLVCRLVMNQARFTKEQYGRLHKAATANSQVRDAGFGALGTELVSWAGSQDPTLSTSNGGDSPDYDPFAD